MNVIQFGLGDLNWKACNDIIEVVNQLNGLAPDEYVIKIYVKSSGGYVDARDTFIKIINQYTHELHIVGAESSAFEMLVYSNGKVGIEDWSWGMYHLGKIAIPYNDGLRSTDPTPLKEYMCKYEDKRSDYIMETLRFTDDEKRFVNDGRNLYINSQRLKEMFNYKLL